VIRQGDIFTDLPRVDFSLQEVYVVDESRERRAVWDELVTAGEPVSVIVPVRPVTAIVATQDCDALRSRDITLCEIHPFQAVEGKSRDTTAPKSWKNLITQHARINQKWFYLPPDERIGFSTKMAVDFCVTLRVSRTDLESFRTHRRGRLNDTAYEHFRERIGEFFRRYPYDEWYALNKDELAEYIRDYPGTEPFSWQQSPD
jgi:hypothetical protein